MDLFDSGGVYKLQKRLLEPSKVNQKGERKMKKPVTAVSIRPRVLRQLEKFAARKNVDLNLLLNTVLQEFLDTWDKEFTAEDHRRWHEQAERLGWPEPATTA